MAEIDDILLRHWGYDSFRPHQREIIESVLDGHDTLGLLPTGGGKSITFQVPAMALPGLTIVVTPLISLMKDQVDNLKNAGIRAAYLHSGLSRREARLAIDRCRFGKMKLLYVSPEKLRGESFLAELKLMNVSLIVVDEAHCISQWGYDFRPSYLKIALLREIFRDVPVLALTATATPEVAEDIKRILEFRPGNVTVAGSFARGNLSYVVRYGDSKADMLMRVLTRTQGTAIVYVRSRRRTKELAEIISSCGISADYYHAGLLPQEKEERQNSWKSGETRVIVATNAFGMGIDKPDVRTVIHYDLPPSLEEYYQEAGRAGRDGNASFAVVLANGRDKGVMSRRLHESFPDKEVIRRVYELAGNFLEVAVGTGYGRLFEFNFGKFCEVYHLQPNIARNSLLILSRAGYIDYVDEIATRSRVMIVAEKDDLYELRLDEESDLVLQTLLRSYPGLFADYVSIYESEITLRSGLNDQQVYEALLRLARSKVIHYVPKRQTPYLMYCTSREEPRHLKLPLAVYEEQRERMRVRIEAMMRFVFTQGECRVKGMLKYFGEKEAKECGQCDQCRETRKSRRTDRTTLQKETERLLRQPGGHSIDYIAEQLSADRETIIEICRELLDSGKIQSESISK
ncbi:MAG: RecQ family ATP-dependent DNA helicase [Paramuribaculum sp.]|nr:RecQ family ATP-dependent DNA helicase [Paramuribaculum sp.]